MFEKSKRSLRKLILGAVAALTLAVGVSAPQEASAGPTDNYFAWSIYAYVRSYGVGNDGTIYITFQDANGNQVTNFPNSSGANLCPSNPNLVVHKDHPLFQPLSKSFQTAGLSRRMVWFGYDATGGVCYLKTVQMFF